MLSHTEVGVALRGARIALALPLESIARELELPLAQIRSLEAGLTRSFATQEERATATRRLLSRFNLPESWATLQPAECEWPAPSAAAEPGLGATSNQPGPIAEIPPLARPTPVSARQRYIALGAASVVVATAIGAALTPAAPPVDENELEDLRSSAPSVALKAPKEVEPEAPGLISDVRKEVRTVKEAMPEVPIQTAPSPDHARPSVNGGPYAILPGSQVLTPTEAPLEIKARAAVAIDLSLGQGATQLTLRAGDRVVLMSGRAERVEVSDRNAVELLMAGRAVQLTPVTPSNSSTSPDQNQNRGVWTVAGR